MFSQDTCYLPFKKELDLFQKKFTDVLDPFQQSQIDAFLLSESNRRQFTQVSVGSEFFTRSCVQSPELLLSLVEKKHFEKEFSHEDIVQFQSHFAKSANNLTSFDRELRRARCQFMMRIIWRDLNRLSSARNTIFELSIFADCCIQATIDFHYSELAQIYGFPIGETSGVVQPLLVLGMGKLGAFELNLSSDVDLIFCYPESGSSAGGDKQLSNHEFFLKLGQRTIKSLDTISADGFVFRVDMRLRPWGQSGALVANYESLETYYQTQGREWERYAMIKARVVATNSIQSLTESSSSSYPANCTVASKASHQLKLMDILEPFTYRKYLDFSAIDALRSMKELINKEVKRKGLKNNVKLGAGGIREIEFIVQAFQLIRGGRESSLRERQLLLVLPLLEQEHYLPEGVVEKLQESYLFLRDTEHAIQAFQDRQTQLLPSDDLNRVRLALMMGFSDWDLFFQELQKFTDFVSEQFQAVVASPQETKPELSKVDSSCVVLWQSDLDEEVLQELVTPLLDGGHCQDFDKAKKIANTLVDFKQSHAILGMQATSRERLDQLMPQLLSALFSSDCQDETDQAVTLQRVLNILSEVARRSAYIVLLLENPDALTQLIKLCSVSPWISQQLATHPALLDELLDVRTLYSPPNISELRSELHSDVIRLPWDDLEAHMEALRYFRLSHALRVAACEVSGILPLMKVSDYLSWMAEVILQHVLQLAWRQMVARYGRPGRAEINTDANTPAKQLISEDADRANAAYDEMDFIVVAYGKLGGIELGHGSDLDLVFVHNADINLETDGERAIDNATFFARLGQKIIHIINTPTISGQLYEIDMRLRPSGNSGLLVSSLTAFEKYQEKDAWVWEHQALVRARVVAGSTTVTKGFNQLREDILSKKRNLPELQAKVVEMREKMRGHLGSKPQVAEFNIKQDDGGIVDIEFMVQYAVLAWAHNQPELLQNTDNIRILESLQKIGLMPEETVQQLMEAYKSYRSTVHRRVLQELPAVVPIQDFQVQRQQVRNTWQHLFDGASI